MIPEWIEKRIANMSDGYELQVSPDCTALYARYIREISKTTHHWIDKGNGWVELGEPPKWYKKGRGLYGLDISDEEMDQINHILYE